MTRCPFSQLCRFWRKPFDQRGAMKFTSYFLDHTGAWRCNEIPGPDSFLGG